MNTSFPFAYPYVFTKNSAEISSAEAADSAIWRNNFMDKWMVCGQRGGDSQLAHWSCCVVEVRGIQMRD